MKEREARAKIVFLVTDGQPVYLDSIFDEGQSSKTFFVDGREMSSPVAVRVRSMTLATEDYAYADLGKVAEEARLEGIRLFCVTLDKDSVPPLSKVFGDSLIYLDRISSLPGRLVEIFRKMTR
jgi:nitric oxide reductase activation protein